MLNGLPSSHGPGAPDDELNVLDLLSRVRICSVRSDGNTNRGIAARVGIDERSAEGSVKNSLTPRLPLNGPDRGAVRSLSRPGGVGEVR